MVQQLRTIHLGKRKSQVHIKHTELHPTDCVWKAVHLNAVALESTEVI